MYVLFRELEVTWAIMEFDYSPHDRTGIKLPKASEELVETLEDNQVFTNELLFLIETVAYSSLFLSTKDSLA